MYWSLWSVIINVVWVIDFKIFAARWHKPLYHCLISPITQVIYSNLVKMLNKKKQNPDIWLVFRHLNIMHLDRGIVFYKTLLVRCQL